MRAVLQRVKHASVEIEGNIQGSINEGLLVLLGITETDNEDDIEWLVRKIVNMRIFSDDKGHMNLSIEKIHGSILIISQFTLYASTKKGNRPSFINAATPQIAIPLYEQFVEKLKNSTSLKIATGIFGADMKVSLLNDGPVTIIIDSKNRE